MNVFTIIRVSSDDQKNGYGPDVQWHDGVVPSAAKLGLEVSETYRRNIEEPATKWERQKFEVAIREAINLFKNGEIGGVIFPRVDRETRFIFSSMPLLSEILKMGMQVYYARELLHLDPNDSDAVDLYLTKVQQSQSYAETLRLNTIRGRKRAARDGQLSLGKASKAFGYDYLSKKHGGDGRRHINEREADVVREIFEWYVSERLPINDVIRRLQSLDIKSPSGKTHWCTGTIHRILTNKIYVGKTSWGNCEVLHATPAIIGQQLFDQAQYRLQVNKEQASRNTKREYLLRGLFCKNCNKRYQGVVNARKTKAGSKEYRYYRCSTNLRVNPKPCSNRSWNTEELEMKVWRGIETVLSRPEVVLAGLKAVRDGRDENLGQELIETNKRLKELDHEQEELLSWAIKGFPEEMVIRQNEMINQDRARLKERRDDLEKRIGIARQAQLDMLAIQEACNLVRGNLVELSFENKRLALDTLNVKVWLDDDNITIEGAIPITDCSIVSTPTS